MLPGDGRRELVRHGTSLRGGGTWGGHRPATTGPGPRGVCTPTSHTPPGRPGETPVGEGRSQCSWLSEEPPAEGSGARGSPSTCVGVKSIQMCVGRSFRALLNCSMALTSTFGVLAVGAVGEPLCCGGFDESSGARGPSPGAGVQGHLHVLRLAGLGPPASRCVSRAQPTCPPGSLPPPPGPSPGLLPAQCWGSAWPRGDGGPPTGVPVLGTGSVFTAPMPMVSMGAPGVPSGLCDRETSPHVCFQDVGHFCS